jgi:threonine dehydrogenase-like Zn-dependent dehydrogenase
MQIVGRQISILGSYMFTHEFAEVLDMIAEKKVNVDDLVTSTRPLASGKSCFDELSDLNSKDVKIVLTNE